MSWGWIDLNYRKNKYVTNLDEHFYINQYLSSIFDTVMLKDIMARKKCPDQNLLRKITSVASY